jgi:hypothetical protein
MIVPLTAACLLAAAQGYAVPPDSLYSLLRVEGGWAGLAKPNLRKDGSVRSEDLGPFQINTAWLRTFTLYWRQKNATATYILLRDDGCAGAYAASAIVRYHWQQSGNLDRAIAFYHAGPKGSPAEMARYLNRYHRVLTESFGNRTR